MEYTIKLTYVDIPVGREFDVSAYPGEGQFLIRMKDIQYLAIVTEGRVTLLSLRHVEVSG